MNRRKTLKRMLLEEFLVFFGTISIILFIILYPNPVLLCTQVYRFNFVGFDGLSNSTSPTVVKFAKDAMDSGMYAEDYIYDKIEPARDIDVWGNLDYWETPEEVIMMGKTDCEGFAILTKSINNIISETDDDMEIKTELVLQPMHVFISKNVSYWNGTDNVTDKFEINKMNKTLESEASQWYFAIMHVFNILPLERKVVFCYGVLFVVSSRIYIIRRFMLLNN